MNWEITRAMLLEPGRHVATVSCRWHVDRGTTQNLEPGQVQLALKLFRREVVSAMNHLEELPQRLAQPFSVGPITSIRQGRQELHIADQVGQAKLDRHVEPIHVAPIRRKVVTAQDSVELRAKNLDQHIRTSRRVDLEQRVQLGAESTRSTCEGSSACGRSRRR